MGRDTEMARGRQAYDERAWRQAFELLSRADQGSPLEAKELELLARAAYMVGNDDDYARCLERAHKGHLDAGRIPPAVRCAFWLGHHLVFRGEGAPAAGWFARAQRLLEREGSDCVERGYLLLADLLAHEFQGDFGAVLRLAAQVTKIGERFGDADLVAIGLMEQGHALMRLGRRADGLKLVDETMVTVTTGELSPIVAGIVYCNTISFCQALFELGRARQWTDVLTRWCEEQPEMVAHKGLCLVHRAELMTLAGAWADALDELRLLGERYTRGVLNRLALGGAAYRTGEVHRLRGQFDFAEAAYQEASAMGHDPQPGLALLRLGQDNREAAAASMRRAMAETARPLDRARLLPSYVEIMLAVGDADAAATACRELEKLAANHGGDALAASAVNARGEVALAAGDPRDALIGLRGAVLAWQALDAPYAAARARVLLGLACRLLDDDDACRLELESARHTFEQLGAGPDLVRVEALASDRPSEVMSAAPSGRGAGTEHGLSDRELAVVRLVAQGMRNKEIAEELWISEHTVARHLQNIFVKLGVSSRTAVSAFCFEHGLV